ncbi:hypothetical protein CHS0354_035959 [Potamilus streckersoni]|uniref:C2H2-type domain-containing protein n=1 Tax=Potamilus streckersoni TaxID=2493646 RepID=A0AAE0WBY3_9BIVA|nr:hypothetical protein CHS0354_035959 [Potamilus streckersoni]
MEEDESFPCLQCGEVFKTRMAMTNHQLYACMTPSTPILQSHQQEDLSKSEDNSKLSVDGNVSSEGGEEELKCDHCHKTFQHRSHLIKHQVIHESGRNFPCEHCDRSFTDPSNLQRHIRSQHHGARSHTCTDCGKTFATSSGLKQHQHIHSSVKPFQCEVCLKAYTQFSNLCRHKRMHADCRQQIKCNDCGQAFSTITSLSKHKRFCEGAMRNGMPRGFPSDVKLTSPALGLPHTTPPTSFNTLFLGAYRPPYPFYPPIGPAFPMFPAMTGLLPRALHSPVQNMGFDRSSDKSSQDVNGNKLSSSKKQSHVGSDTSDGSELSLSSDRDNDLSDNESDLSLNQKPRKRRRITSLPHNSSYYLSRSSTQVTMSAQSPNPTILKTSTPIVPRTAEQDAPCDFSKSKAEKPSLKPIAKVKVEIEAGDQPLDLSQSKEVSPPDIPRKTHVFGEMKPSTTADTKLHYAYPQFSNSLMMEQALRIAENKEKIQQSMHDVSKFLPYGRFHSPSYQIGFSPFPIMVPNCDKSISPIGKVSESFFPSAGNKLKDRYACKFCGKIFPRSANLTRHLRTHTGEQPYKCKYCERSFSISSNLQRHVRNIHNKEKPFKCSLCDRCFGQQTNLDRHVKKHETEGMNVTDSPINENELDDKDEAYFSEIRNFIGKATEQDVNQNSINTEVSMEENVNDQEEDPSVEAEEDDSSEMMDGEDMDNESGLEESDMKKEDSPESDGHFVLNGFHSTELADEVYQKNTFELKQGFNPLLCST